MMTRLALLAPVTGFLVACAAFQPPAEQDAVARPAAAIEPGRGIAARPDRRATWLSPEIKKQKTLFFVSDAGTGDVYLYAPGTLTLVGRVTGFGQPLG
ncbi:MAG: hypothetical protein ABSF08_05755, partial [Candidatus Cybelea sp.]